MRREPEARRPIRPELAVVVLGGGAGLSGVEVINGGGNGIGVPPGVSTTVRDCYHGLVNRATDEGGQRAEHHRR